MAAKQHKVSDVLRAAIEASEMSRYRIAVEAQIDHASMSRFMHGQTGLSLENIDRLAVVLGLEMVPKRRTGRKTKKGK
jgi:plasmid maintenance system antidote protein VapI